MTEKTKEILFTTMNAKIYSDIWQYIECHNTNDKEYDPFDNDFDGCELDTIVDEINARNELVESSITVTREDVIADMEAKVTRHNEEVRTDPAYSEDREQHIIVIDKWIFNE